MALGSTQPLTEMSTRNFPGGKGRLARGADNLNAICEPIIYKIWKPQRLTTLWCGTGIALPLRPGCFTPRYLLDRMLGGPQNRSGCYGEEKNVCAGNRIPAV
jgi:hypothetical protein